MLFQAVALLLESVIGFFTLLFLLRFFMQAFRVSFRNPLGNFVVHLTNWAVLPLRRVVPGLFGLDLASLLPAYLLQVVLLLALFSLRAGWEGFVGGSLIALLFWQGAIATLRIVLYLVIGILFLQAILSWVNPYSPLAQPLAQFTRPLLDPIRRVVRPVAGIDLSPLIAILLVQLLLVFL